jgi:(p)ppGpp synthase/HD superfamily hydrolase
MIPYVSHLMAVAGIVLDYGGTEDEAIAALLHDAVEDQGGTTTLETIRRLFGPEVAATVQGCSDTDQTPKPPWRKRKESYLAHLAEATPSVILVSAADKLANARSMITDLREYGDTVWNGFSAGPSESLWYYRSVVEALRDRGLAPALFFELESAVSELERIAGVLAAEARLRS